MRTGRRQVTAEINITPLLDLAWVLLVIFILTTVAIVQGVDVDLPKTSDQKTELPTETATVSIDEAGVVYLNEQPIQLPQLEEKLRLYTYANPDLPVILRADKGLLYERVVQVLDSIKKTGVVNLALATEVQK